MFIMSKNKRQKAKQTATATQPQRTRQHSNISDTTRTRDKCCVSHLFGMNTSGYVSVGGPVDAGIVLPCICFHGFNFWLEEA